MPFVLNSHMINLMRDGTWIITCIRSCKHCTEHRELCVFYKEYNYKWKANASGGELTSVDGTSNEWPSDVPISASELKEILMKCESELLGNRWRWI